MKDFAIRLADWPSEKRRLLERLLRRERLNPPLPHQGAEEQRTHTRMVDVLRSATGTSNYAAQIAAASGEKERVRKERVRVVYNAYHEQLDSAIFLEHSIFMNLGYVANELPQCASVTLPERMINRNFIKLVLEVIGDCDLDGRRVLDVGCGRGGTVQVVNTHFQPRHVVGLDLCVGAISFCHQHHHSPITCFVLGDAEHLPFDDSSFDAITNLESSHHYPNPARFYEEVYRTLAFGGHFLYGTVLPAWRLAEDSRFLQSLGFMLYRDRDVTSNVLASCDQNRARLFDGIGADRDERLAAAIGLPGSTTYEDMRSGRHAYRIFNFRKTSAEASKMTRL